jgi:sugar/nucleoside kinase (ribokinase family)
VRLDAIGFGSLNLDEFWEVSAEFLSSHGLRPGEEYIRDIDWFEEVYPELKALGNLKAVDPGGSAANMVAALFKMGFETGFYGATGKDDLERMRPEELGKPETLRRTTSEFPAGRCLALIDSQDPDRDRALVILPNANDIAGSDKMDLECFAAAKWVHLTSFVSEKPLKAQINLVKSLPVEVGISFDPGVIYSAVGIDILQPILIRTDVLFTTREEIMALTGQSIAEQGAADLLAMGTKTIVLKLSTEGLMGFQRDKSWFQTAVPPAAVKDRTGAGDVAAAGFIAGKLKSLPFDACLELAAAGASKSIEGYGRSTYPDRNFLENFVAKWQG